MHNILCNVPSLCLCLSLITLFMCLDDRDAITDKSVADQFGVGLERPSPLHRLHPTPLSPQPPFFSVASQHSPTPYPTPASQLPFIFPF